MYPCISVTSCINLLESKRHSLHCLHNFPQVFPNWNLPLFQNIPLWSRGEEGGSGDHFYTWPSGNQSKEETRNHLTLWTSNQKKKVQVYAFVVPCPKCSKTRYTCQSLDQQMHCHFADLLSCWVSSVEQNGSNGKVDEPSNPFHPLQWSVPRLHAWSTIFMFYTTALDTTPDPGTGQSLVLALQHEAYSDLKRLLSFSSFITI